MHWKQSTLADSYKNQPEWTASALFPTPTSFVDALPSFCLLAVPPGSKGFVDALRCMLFTHSYRYLVACTSAPFAAADGEGSTQPELQGGLERRSWHAWDLVPAAPSDTHPLMSA